jgi:NTE family protein
VWSPIIFENHRHMDGGFYSAENADLAAGFERVLALALKEPDPPFGVIGLESMVRTLEDGGSRVAVIHPDSSIQDIVNSVHGNVLDPSIGPRIVELARAQGRRVADEHIASFWKDH